MSKDLIAFSGGLDSVYLTYKLLTESTNDITLLILASDTGLCDGISKTMILNMQPVISELKKIRDFNVKYIYAESSEVTSYDTDRWFSYIISKVADDFNNGVYDRLITGSCYEQNDGAFFKNSSVRGLSAIIDGQKLFHSMVTNGSIWNPLITHDLHQNYNRYHPLKYLPKNLFDKTLYCSNGRTHENSCGICDKCCFNNRVLQMMAEGASDADVDNWRKAKSLEYGGTGTRDCTWRAWIQLEETGKYHAKKGVATDVDPNLVIPDVVTTKEDFLKWYSTIEYNPKIDWQLQKWGLDKTGWNPES